MKFIRTKDFNRDFENLLPEQKLLVKESFPLVVKALTGNVDLYGRFKIKKMKGHPQYYEGHLQINLVFTLEFEYDAVQKVCKFRRIGNHSIYDNP